MTHPLNMPHVAGVRCSDLPTPGEWLRALAGNLALIRTWWAVPMVVAHLLIHIADIVAFWRHGQASVLYPVLRGGQDHSARAVLADRNPMVCRGEFTTGAACSTRRRRPPMAPKVVVPWPAPSCCRCTRSASRACSPRSPRNGLPILHPRRALHCLPL